METRSLTRALRASPASMLLSSRQMPRMQSPILTTLRYNSTKSSIQTPPVPTATKSQSNAAESTPTTSAPAETKDFDALLDKLDLGNRANAGAAPTPVVRPNFAGNVARSVSAGSGAYSRRDQTASQLASRKLELKLGPTLGRQVQVEPERGLDLASAIRSLGATVSTNKIRQQARDQKFHMRKGAVRKEQRRQRWRKLFRFSFQETVKKIQRMQAQGW
ncbi:hypothetical protein N7492_005131 [Penicillium capsulatum]|uniref:Ribosomal protein S21 n=1 Tax=Penicillium capsulatum TaxID=69766 RepID=A0A9W9LRU1_9EURO|nr:hypothetical protein N7492_005131 [Penicillium capsulatum]KAJ6135763.1 hypothetical protein N7512_000923 [Penicillium capsulatum]